MTERKTKGIPDEIDKHVGDRLRQLRQMRGLSQEKLGDHVGVTFQQVQKYERGTNRISASRLYQFSLILEARLDWFYEGLPKPDKTMRYVPLDVYYDKETINLVDAYYLIANSKTRKAFVELMKKCGI